MIVWVMEAMRFGSSAKKFHAAQVFIDDVVVEFVAAQIFPDVFDWVQGVGRQVHEGDVIAPVDAAPLQKPASRFP
jgi:hypothetical protein